jgi:prevent-host-death family protein
MPVIGIRELSRETASVIEGLVESGEPVVVTKQGKPVAALTTVDPSQAQDLVLSLAPEIRQSSSSTDVPKSPRKTQDLDAVAAELIEEARESEEGLAALAKYDSELEGQRVALLREVNRLFSEAPERLVGVADSLVGSWMVSTRALVGGSVEAALESAHALQQRVTGAKVRAAPARPPATKVRASTRPGRSVSSKRPSSTGSSSARASRAATSSARGSGGSSKGSRSTAASKRRSPSS